MSDAGLVAIARDLAPARTAGPVLRAKRVGMHRLARDRPDRAQHLDLLVAQRLGVQTGRRLHRHQGQHLQQMTLDHVAHGAHTVVKPGTLPDPSGFRMRDLHVIDVIAIPKGFEQQVGEAEHQDVLNRALAQIVIDAKDLRLAETVPDASIENGCTFEVEPEGFLDHQAGPMPVLGVETLSGQVVHDAAVVLGRHRQIGHEVGRYVRLLAQPLGQAYVTGGIFQVAFDEEHPAKQTLQHTRVGCAGQSLGEPRPGLLAPFRIRPGTPAESDDPRLRMKALRRLDVVERREQLDADQITRRAEDQDGARIQHGLGASIADKCDNVSPVILLPSQACRAGNRFARI